VAAALDVAGWRVRDRWRTLVSAMASAQVAVGLKPGDRYLGIIIPTLATLSKYGWDVGRFVMAVHVQAGRCGVCERVPETSRLVIDHAHVPKWKKMPPGRRRLFVRGLCCRWCNGQFLGRFATLARTRSVLRYLERFEVTRPDA